MNESLFFSIVAIICVIAFFLTWFFIHKAKAKERQLLIEKGVAYDQLPDIKVFNFSFPWLKMGIVITTITVGTSIAVYIMESGGPEIIVPLAMFLFGGIGLIIAHYVDRQNDK